MRCVVAAVGVGVASVAVHTAGAQQPTPMIVASALDGRLDHPTRQAIDVILDSAARGDLPVAPLVDKALEGSAKQASGPRIVLAVRMLASDLRTARGALGAAIDEPTLAAGVTALRAGVTREDLRELRDSRKSGGGLTWPLTVLTDLIARGVPTDTAVDVVTGMARAGATDVAFRRFAADVLQDIEAGVLPGAAAVARAGVDLPPKAMQRGPQAVPAAHMPAPPRAPGHRTPPRHHPTR